jgi:hypothetical protein
MGINVLQCEARDTNVRLPIVLCKKIASPKMEGKDMKKRKHNRCETNIRTK